MRFDFSRLAVGGFFALAVVLASVGAVVSLRVLNSSRGFLGGLFLVAVFATLLVSSFTREKSFNGIEAAIALVASIGVVYQIVRAVRR